MGSPHHRFFDGSALPNATRGECFAAVAFHRSADVFRPVEAFGSEGEDFKMIRRVAEWAIFEFRMYPAAAPFPIPTNDERHRDASDLRAAADCHGIGRSH